MRKIKRNYKNSNGDKRKKTKTKRRRKGVKKYLKDLKESKTNQSAMLISEEKSLESYAET